MNGKPYYITSKKVDVFINGLLKDDKVGKAALKLLDKHHDDRFFFFVHFAEIDHRGHHSGEGSEQTRQAYLSADSWLGKIVGKLEELGIRDETLVYVTSDHGFDVGEKRHKDAPYVWLATDDPLVMRRGTRKDIAPTILKRFGVDLSTIDPPLDGHPLTEPHTLPIW
jgi:arylsulfatase A-like enzyme